MRSTKTEGIIIKRKNIGEADRILTIITPHYGKISVKATGVRKLTSRRSAHIELLNHTALGLYQGKGMHVLTEAKMIEDFTAIKQDFNKVGLAYHLCELVDGLCPENQENSKVYDLLKTTLNQLAERALIVRMPQSVRADIEDYTLGTYGMEVNDAPRIAPVNGAHLNDTLHSFEIDLLSELGYWDKTDALSKNFDTHAMIETILERKLKSRNIFSKLQ